MNDKSKPNNYVAAIKGALVKKHAAQHPDAKTKGSGKVKAAQGNTPKGPPVRRAANRGG